MADVKQWSREILARNMIGILNQKGYDTVYAADLAQARQIVLETVPKGARIALGGSVTVDQLNLLETFRGEEYRLFDRYAPGLTSEKDHELRRQSMVADYLITGTNAITKNGELVNIDCSGNKTAGMIFGPKHVIIVTGVNKVVDTLDEAMKRLYRIAPLNSKRIGHNTPCTVTGVCCDEACDTEQRMCNYISIINNGRKYPGKYRIVMISEEIGY